MEKQNFQVFVTDTDINSHKSETKPMWLKRHWAVNARRNLAVTLETKLMSALTQSVAAKVLAN